MQLGAAKGRKKDDELAAALGGLDVGDDMPLLSHQIQQQQEAEQSYQQQQQQQNYSSQPVAPPAPTKDANPFGEVEQAA